VTVLIHSVLYKKKLYEDAHVVGWYCEVFMTLCIPTT